MIRKINIEINGSERVVQYEGDDEMEIAEQINRDENELLYYMRTGDDKGSKSFCFQGYMIKKELICTALFAEPDF